MLVLTRKEGESVSIYPADDLDLSTPIGDVFDAPIKIKINKAKTQVSMGIEAPQGLKVVREEIVSA
ncbi:MAG: carbon storage regulator [Gammaproteobacteria bacterium]|nr:carbon storage regulator [Gammaproteobacteria bacterium]